MSTSPTVNTRKELVQQVRAALLLRGSTVAAWGRARGVDQAYISKTISGKLQTRGAAELIKALAAELDMDLSALLPAPKRSTPRPAIDRQPLAARFQQEAVRLKLSSEQMAELGGVGRSMQHFIELGTRAANTDYLQPLAEIGMDVNYVLTGKRSATVQHSATAQHNAAKRGRA